MNSIASSSTTNVAPTAPTSAADSASIVKIRDLLPDNTSQRTDMLLGLLKSSYTNSLHSADSRLASLTQEVASLRAQITYLESKLRASDALAQEAGRAADEQKKRCDGMVHENMTFKSENAMLRKENEQLQQFKTILLAAANGMGVNGNRNSSLPRLHDYATSTNYHDSYQAYAPSSASRITSSVDRTAPTFSSPSNFLDASLTTPYVKRSSDHFHSHVMPSPLSADALNTPAPVPVASKSRHQVASSDELLNEINANLMSSSQQQRHQHSSPRSDSHTFGLNGFTHQSSGSHHSPSPLASSYNSTSFTATATSSSLADQARSLFHLAQSRLPHPLFTDFVALVHQFRSHNSGDAYSSSRSAEQHRDEVRSKASAFLHPHYSDILDQFNQLVHATQER